MTKFLEIRILELRPRKSQIEIATEAGFINPNVISMLKNGAAKLPLDRVLGLARALECDPRLLFKLALEQAGTDTTARAIEEIFGAVVTRNEVAWLDEIRDASNHSETRIQYIARVAMTLLNGS